MPGGMQLAIQSQHRVNLPLTREGALDPLPTAQSHLTGLFRGPQESADGMR